MKGETERSGNRYTPNWDRNVCMEMSSSNLTPFVSLLADS
jgi:hypothetical protein